MTSTIIVLDKLHEGIWSMTDWLVHVSLFAMKWRYTFPLLYVNRWDWRFVRVSFKCFAFFVPPELTSFLVLLLGSVSSALLPSSSWAGGCFNECWWWREYITSWERIALSLCSKISPYGDCIFLILWFVG